jgi:hypothetical protein
MQRIFAPTIGQRRDTIFSRDKIIASGHALTTYMASRPALLTLSIALAQNSRVYAPPRKSENPQGVNLKGR